MASQFSKDYRQVASNLASETLKPIVVAYAMNMERVTTMGVFPVECIYWSILASKVGAMARVRCGHTVEDTAQDRLDPRVREVALRLLHAEIIQKLTLPPVVDSNIAWLDGTSFLKFLIHTFKESGSEFNTGIDSILYAMILNAYAAFESLATDLWYESCNASDALALQYIKEHPDMTLASGMFGRYGTNFHGIMGNAFREFKKGKFQTLDELIGTYRASFGASIDSVFSAHPDVIAAGKVRHLVAHRGGLVDEKFKQELSAYPALSGVMVGSYLPVDGPLVCSLVDALARTSTDLILFVDAWIKANTM
jgi:hypothetical protein